MVPGNRRGPSPAWQALVLGLVLLALVVTAAGQGYIKITPSQTARVILARVLGDESWLAGLDPTFPYVVVDVRLPRILTSAVVGAGLALAGVIFQGLLLNPLADPYTLGVSAGAAFGASLALLLGLGGPLAVSLSAFLFAALTLVAVIALSAAGGRVHPGNLILSGVIVAAILSAGLSFLKYVADEQVSVIIFWLLGSFASRTWTDVGLTSLFVSAGLAVGLLFARDLNVMSLGGRTAESLGVDTTRVRLILLVTASLMTAVCVSVSGIIGFVGLIIPHLMRFFTGPDNRALLPVSALAGAVLLLTADTAARVLLPGEIPIGVLTALIGGPVFCYIFYRRKGRVHG
ncbi:MAG: iron ABC transporter permease [Thermodesulfobacteriota bacterium]